MDRVYLVNQLNSDLYDGGLLQQQYALRKRVCIDWRKWQGRSVWADCEYDEYDTPAANYFVWLDDQGVARGMMRAIPTTLPYMQSNLWPDMVNGHDLPSAPHVWEISRVCFEAPVLGRRDMVRVMQACDGCDRRMGRNDRRQRIVVDDLCQVRDDLSRRTQRQLARA